MLGTLRLILAIGVVASHTHGYRFDQYPDTGIVAVCAFFFLSGFLMPATLERNYFGQVRPYLVNRFLRIFPIYWIALLAALLILPRLPEWKSAYDFGISPILQNIGLLGLNQWSNDTLYIGPAWTLDIELQFYLMVPVLVMIPARARLILMTIISVVGLYMLFNPWHIRHIDRSFLPWAPFFFGGMALYMRHPNFSLFKPGGLFDREMGELAYPLFVLHPIVIQAISLKLDFWPLMAANTAASLMAAFLVHRLASPLIDGLRRRTKQRVLSPIS